MIKVDIFVVGGSTGGVLAALSAAKEGKIVLLSEQTDWVGGQFTSQAVPPDEHCFIESFGCTKTYADFRNRIRSFYKTNYPVTESAKSNDVLNIGNGTVSRICHEPKVALHLFYEMLLPYINAGLIQIMLNTKVISADVNNNYINSLEVKNIITNKVTQIKALYYIDATDLGDLLPITGTEYVTGAESKQMTTEPNALDEYSKQDQQPITWVAALDFVEGEDHTIEKPEQYDFFRNLKTPYSDKNVLSWYGPDSSTKKEKKFAFSQEGELFPLWSYRRIIDPSNFKNNFYKTEITLLNWPQNDYFLGNIIDTDNIDHNLYMAKQLTLSFIYWLQTEAPREDGGIGYKEIRLRKDVLGTDDGLAKMPYIRESRRIIAQTTIIENNTSAKCSSKLPTYFDTVGVACYHIDLHITTLTNTFYYDEGLPSEIPLGALIPIKTKNLIAGCKNIGTTHLTNGCFRTHPVEWNIGEVAGLLAAEAISKNVLPIQIRDNRKLLTDFQNKLLSYGIELHWPSDLN